MITAIEIENFKGIGERTRVEIKPITLLFGPNSVGKSTILHAMQLAREILTRGNVNADKIAGGSLDLGGFRQYVHNHDVTKTVRLRFELDMGSEDLLTAFTVPEYFLKNPHLADEDMEDVSNIGDEVFDAWVELEINSEQPIDWARHDKVRPELAESAEVSTITVGLNGEPFARMKIQPFRVLTHLNLHHELVAWDRIDDHSIGRLDAIWPVSRPHTANLFFSGSTVEWEELNSPPPGTIVCKTPVTQASDESSWIFRSTSQFSDLGVPDLDVEVDQITASSPDGRYLRRWGIRYRADQADKTTGENFVKTCFPTPWFPTDKSAFCRMGRREVEEWPTLDEPISASQKTEVPPNLLKRLTFTPRDDFFGFLDAASDDTERFSVYVSLLNRLILGPVAVLQRELRQLRHVGPIRESVARNRQPKGMTEPGDWIGGLAAWDELARNVTLANEVSNWLSHPDRLNAGYELFSDCYRQVPANFRWVNQDSPEEVQEADESPQLDIEATLKVWESYPAFRRVMFRPVGKEIDLQPADLGQGITQMVPVLTAILMAEVDGEKPRGTLVAIEQPELHIHPRLQAALGDAFIEAIQNPRNQFLIETHSEHLMLRLLRRIREAIGQAPSGTGRTPPAPKALSPDDVQVLYVQSRAEIEPGETGVVIHTLRVDDTGEFIDHWPKGFFEERSEELF